MVEVVEEQLSRLEDNAEQLERLTVRVDELVAENAAKVHELDHLTMAKDALDGRLLVVLGEKDALSASVLVKDAAIEQYQQAAVTVVSAGVGGQGAAAELKKVKGEYNKLFIGYQDELREKLDAWDSLEALQAPQAVGGSFKRVLAVVEAAAAVTNKQVEWDRAACEALVVDMVKSMLSRKEADNASRVKELSTKVYCLLVLCFVM